MKFTHVAQMLFGASVVYVVMAACSDEEIKNRGAAVNSGGANDASGAGQDGSSKGGGGAGFAGNAEDAFTADGPGQGGADGPGQMADSSADDANSTGAVDGNSDGGFFDSLVNPVPDAYADVSGTRLKGKFLLGSDGTKQYERDIWYDSQRQEDCTFELAADGKKRCLAVGYTEGYYLYYLDSLCTRLVIMIPPPKTGCVGGPAPKYLRVKDPDSYCPPAEGVERMHIYSLVGTLTSVPAQLFDKGLVPPCQPTVRSVPSTWDKYEYGAEVPASSFVEATKGTDP